MNTRLPDQESKKVAAALLPSDFNFGAPLGIAWFFLYGHAGVPAVTFMPKLRELGAEFTKVYLFWDQLEPQKGMFDWKASDALVAQFSSANDALISIFASSTWATRTASTMLPPSPAKNLEDYYRFIHTVVSRYRGRVRYWQNDAEPNNPVFWSGTKEEFVEHLKVFHRAVKDADPSALVVIGGYDGLFVPPDLQPLPGQRTVPFPQQASGLEFFDYALAEGCDAFDVFDLRLYADPYTIASRVDYFRKKVAALGSPKPIFCTEYGGPNFFEFPENRKYVPLIAKWTERAKTLGTASGDARVGLNEVEQMYENPDVLAPQTRMFMQGCPTELEEKYYRIQGRDLVVRNVFALSAGVQRTLYWQLLAAPADRGDLMNLMYGKVGLLGPEGTELSKRFPTAEVFTRMASHLAGLSRVTRVQLHEYPTVFCFKIERTGRSPLHVIWEYRDRFSGEDAPPTDICLPWAAYRICRVSASDAFGTSVEVKIRESVLELPVSVTPIYIETA